MRRTTIFSILVVLLLGLSACALNPLDIIKSNPEVANFLAEHPNADIQMVKLTTDYVEPHIDEIREICGEQMMIKNYYQATIIDADTNFKMIIYIDHESKDLECLRKYTEITNETQDEEAKKYKEEFMNKEEKKEMTNEEEKKEVKENVNEYPEVFELKSEIVDNKVKLSWDAVNENETFQYYKVVRSENNDELQYPMDGYIEVISDRLKTEYVDSEPLKEAYYRITAVYKDMKTNSNVIKVKFENEMEDNEDEAKSDEKEESDDDENELEIENEVNETNSDDNQTIELPEVEENNTVESNETIETNTTENVTNSTQ